MWRVAKGFKGVEKINGNFWTYDKAIHVEEGHKDNPSIWKNANSLFDIVEEN